MADEQSVFYRCLLAVAETVRGLDLGGAQQNVMVRKLPYKNKKWTVGIFVTPVTETLIAGGGTNVSNDPGYRVQVTIAQRNEQSNTENLDRFLLWRQTVRREFHHKRLSGVAESIINYVEPGPVFLPIAYDDDFDVQAMVIRCTCRD